MYDKTLIFLSLFSSLIAQGMELAKLVKQEDIFDNHIIVNFDIKSYGSLLKTCKEINDDGLLHKRIYTLFKNNDREKAEIKVNKLNYEMLFFPVVYLGIQEKNSQFVKWYIEEINQNSPKLNRRLNSDIQRAIGISSENSIAQILQKFINEKYLDHIKLQCPKNMTIAQFTLPLFLY